MHRSTPRTDCPKKLPDPPAPLSKRREAAGFGDVKQHEQPMNDLQKNIVAVAAKLNDLPDLRAEALGLRTEQEGVRRYCRSFLTI